MDFVLIMISREMGSSKNYLFLSLFFPWNYDRMDKFLTDGFIDKLSIVGILRFVIEVKLENALPLIIPFESLLDEFLVVLEILYWVELLALIMFLFDPQFDSKDLSWISIWLIDFLFSMQVYPLDHFEPIDFLEHWDYRKLSVCSLK